MKKWVYKVITTVGNVITEHQLNSLGLDGWELVTAIEYETDNVMYYFQYIFKKESS